MITPDEHETGDIPHIEAWEKTIETSLVTRKKLVELMDQIDETIIALRTEVDHAKLRRGEM